MRNIERRLVLALLIHCSAQIGFPSRSVAQDDAGRSAILDRIRGIASAQLSADLFGNPAWTRTGVDVFVAAGEIDLEEVSYDLPRVHLFRASKRREYSRAPLLVAAVDNEILLLGGFQSPELRRFVQILDLHVRDPGAALLLSKRLALVADRNVGGEVWFADQLSELKQEDPVASWGRKLATSPTRDTVIVNRDASLTVRINSLSQAQDLAHSWEWKTFVFRYDANGDFAGWSLRMNEELW
jgi:hypothetical protein